MLEAVDLWPFAENQGGLYAGMAADTFSQGQKQLFSLARAILRRRIRSRESATAAIDFPVLVQEKGDTSVATTLQVQCDGAATRGVLLLDEVSSSVDTNMDRKMHALIKHEFAGYTIIMVSHRLDMVVDFDRVLIVDDGRVVESGSPRDFIEQEGSRFSELWAVGRYQDRGGVSLS